MNCKKVVDQIADWLIDKVNNAGASGFVVGISGGVDSAVVSTLCAETGMPMIVAELPIKRTDITIANRSKDHKDWLLKKYPNVQAISHDLSSVLDQFVTTSPVAVIGLVEANLRSRLRMCALYSISNKLNLLVVGTGNKIEDMGVQFFTKYGDGGVDLSPIGNLYKSEVRELAKHLEINNDIVEAVPTDELWTDCRSDEDQLGATYDELEWAMKFCIMLDINTIEEVNDLINKPLLLPQMLDRQAEVLRIYIKRHVAGQHKMHMPPICYPEKD